MGIIRIIANGIELDYVRESLRVRKDNNAFISDFKISHSSFPFLIPENARTKNALGTRELTSIGKRKVVPVTVLEQSNSYYGELEIVSYMNGFRKCNLKYGSDVLKIMGKKLSELLPSISIIPGETDPVPFTEGAIELVPGYEEWGEYPLDFAGKIYPEIKYQFPVLRWANKFWDEQPEPGEDWYNYKGKINDYRPTSPIRFRENAFLIEGEAGQDITVTNQNVPSPQLFLLGILDYAFATAGYTIGGAFAQSDFIRRLLVLSTKNNLCKVPIVPEAQVLTFADFPYIGTFIYSFFQYEFFPEASGNYEFNYHVKEPLYPGGITTSNHRTMLTYKVGGGPAANDENTVWVYKNTNDPDERVFNGSFSVSVGDDQVGDPIRIQWLRWYEVDGYPLEFDIRWANESKDFQMMHPTIALGRYAPDWTLSDFINELKKLFCLDIRFDDLARTVNFDYTGNLLKSGNYYPAGKSLAISEYAPPSYAAIMLRYDNDQDNFLYIDSTGTQLNRKEDSDLVLDIASKFKLVPHDTYTSDISLSEDKDGVGLMIYDPGDFEGFKVPVTSADYDGQTLSIDGALGIYNIFWKRVAIFRLNSSAIAMEGPFTETEIGKMLALQKVVIDHQAYIITSLEYSETLQNNYLVKLQLESITL